MTKTVAKTLLLLFFLTFSMSGFAQKTDKVFLKNGDELTGEIKSLKFAKLRYDMSGPGIIHIKWEEITKIESDKIFQITIRNGAVFVSTLEEFYVNQPNIKLNDIVEIIQIKYKFLKSLDGDINLGFNYRKSNKIFNLVFGTSITYRKPKTEINLKLNSVLSKSVNDTILSKRQDASISYFHNLKNNLMVMSVFGWEQNTQLGLANRFLFTGGGGKMVVNNNQFRLLTAAGLSYNVEQSSENTTYRNNLESLFTVQFKQFRYSTPKISIDSEVTLYPGLTDWGRIRFEFQLNTKVEIFKDFNVGLNFYDIFDNRPPDGAVSKNDFGLNITVGYEFGK